MENLKKGDIVCMAKDRFVRIKSDHEFKVVSVGKNYITINSFIEINKRDLIKIGESQMQYEGSNRYKLAQAVKERVKLIKSKEIYATAEILSLATGNSKTYFSTQTAKSKFLSRGDLSEKTYQEMLTDLAFAEREVLGIGAKTVEEPNKETIDAINVECDSDVFLTDQDLVNSIEEKPTLSRNHDDHVDAISFGLIEKDFKEKPKSNKTLFIGAAVVIFIVLILFILNNSQVV